MRLAFSRGIPSLRLWLALRVTILGQVGGQAVIDNGGLHNGKTQRIPIGCQARGR